MFTTHMLFPSIQFFQLDALFYPLLMKYPFLSASSYCLCDNVLHLESMFFIRVQNQFSQIMRTFLTILVFSIELISELRQLSVTLVSIRKLSTLLAMVLREPVTIGITFVEPSTVFVFPQPNPSIFLLSRFL